MAAYQLLDVGVQCVQLTDVSLDPQTVWRPLDDARVGEIESNIMDGNWMASPIAFPELIGQASGEPFLAKACMLAGRTAASSPLFSFSSFAKGL